jgi:hypothetical protein
MVESVLQFLSLFKHISRSSIMYNIIKIIKIIKITIVIIVLQFLYFNTNIAVILEIFKKVRTDILKNYIF